MYPRFSSHPNFKYFVKLPPSFAHFCCKKYGPSAYEITEHLTSVVNYWAIPSSL